jgi:hypothetical protein
MVVKKDGRREKFDRQKVLNGLLRACEKRPVPISKLEQIVNEAESFVIESQERERKTSELGELIMNRLRRYDKVAYVRFASVYLDFKDVKEFMNELKDLVKVKAAKKPKVLSSRAKRGTLVCARVRQVAQARTQDPRFARDDKQSVSQIDFTGPLITDNH